MKTTEKPKPETLCAWCHPGQPSPSGSHGICKAHADGLRAEIRMRFPATQTRGR